MFKTAVVKKNGGISTGIIEMLNGYATVNVNIYTKLSCYPTWRELLIVCPTDTVLILIKREF